MFFIFTSSGLVGSLALKLLLLLLRACGVTGATLAGVGACGAALGSTGPMMVAAAAAAAAGRLTLICGGAEMTPAWTCICGPLAPLLARDG